MAHEAPLMLSVSGMRGLVGTSLTPIEAAKFGAAVGSWLQGPDASSKTPQRRREGDGGGRRVLVGRDSRPSGEMIEAAAVAGLLATGCEVVRLGVLSTPGVAVMLDPLRADGGLVITASHNPLPWNGIKPLRHDGVAPPPEEAREIIRRFREEDFIYVTASENIEPLRWHDGSAQTHAERAAELVDVDRVRAAGLSCVVDSVHGAGAEEARWLMEMLGVEMESLYPEPTGLFPHPPEPREEHLGELCKRMAASNADVGFAQDTDADRLALVDEDGKYLGEEYTLALCAMHLLHERPAPPAGSPDGAGYDVVAANLSTSRMLDDIAAAEGAKVVRSAVGEANVAAAMRKHSALIGGEGNGGIMHRSLSQVRDSLVGMALILEMLAIRDQPLSRIAASTPAYAIVKDKVDADPEVIESLADKLPAAFPEAKADTQDGVRLDWPDRWVHVRASNTEPIIRLIAEARDEPAANELIQRARAALGLER